MLRKLKLFISCVVLTLTIAAAAVGTAVPAYATETLDLTKKGSITINVTYNGKAVSGGEVGLIKVADLVETEDTLDYKCTSTFKGCEDALREMDPLTIGSTLMKKVTSSTKKNTKTINSKGQAVYSGLTPGVYLVVQTKAADGYKSFDPIVIELPIPEDTGWNYDVDASPKLEVEKSTTTQATTTTPPPKKLPQTGQLNWPIPVLATAGAILIVLGLAFRWSRKRR